MEGRPLVLNQKERSCLVVIIRVREKAMTIKEAAEVMRTNYCNSTFGAYCSTNTAPLQ